MHIESVLVSISHFNTIFILLAVQFRNMQVLASPCDLLNMQVLAVI